MGQIFLTVIMIDVHFKWMKSICEIDNSTKNYIYRTHVNAVSQIWITKSVGHRLWNLFDYVVVTLIYLKKINGIKHLCIAPYHPSLNGQAERAVQTFKLGVKEQSTGTL